MKTGLGSLELGAHPMLIFTGLVPGPLRSISHPCFVAAENLHTFNILRVVKKPMRRELNKRKDNLGGNTWVSLSVGPSKESPNNLWSTSRVDTGWGRSKFELKKEEKPPTVENRRVSTHRWGLRDIKTVSYHAEVWVKKIGWESTEYYIVITDRHHVQLCNCRKHRAHVGRPVTAQRERGDIKRLVTPPFKRILIPPSPLDCECRQPGVILQRPCSRLPHYAFDSFPRTKV